MRYRIADGVEVKDTGQGTLLWVSQNGVCVQLSKSWLTPLPADEVSVKVDLIREAEAHLNSSKTCLRCRGLAEQLRALLPPESESDWLDEETSWNEETKRAIRRAVRRGEIRGEE